MVKMTRFAMVAVIVLVMLSSASFAASYKLTLFSDAQHPRPGVTGYIYSAPNVSENVYIGPVWVNVSDGTNSKNMCMLCVDLLGTINFGETWDANLASGYKPDGVISNSAWDKTVYLAQHGYDWSDGKGTNVQKAALQTAIWELTRDDYSTWDSNILTPGTTGRGFALGNISGATKDDVLAQVRSYLDLSLGASSGYGANYSWFSATNAAKQDLVYFVPVPMVGGTPVTAVPDASALLLAPMGLTVVGFARRRIAQRI